MADTSRGSLEPYIKDEINYYPHQLEGIRTLARMRSFLLADDMGLGKTLQTLTVFGIDVFMGKSKSAIVICPATLKGNWMAEIDQFTRFYALELGRTYRKDGVTPRAATPMERREQLAKFAEVEGPKILVVNYEQVKAHLEELDAMRFDVSIIDEAHNIKNPRSAKTKAVQKLWTPRSFLLTGSPLLNRVDELWSLLYRIDPASFPNYYTFRSRYCIMGGYKGKEIVGVQNEQELAVRLQSVMIRRLKSEVLNLKEPQIIRRLVDLHVNQRKFYNQALEELIIEKPDELEPLEVENAMVRFMRLKQICATTATLFGPEHDDSGKLDLAIEDAVEILENGNKIIVFTQFRAVVSSYSSRITAVMGEGFPVFQLHGDVDSSMRQSVVNKWAATKGPAVIVCMLQVAGVGLNMTAARHIQFIDKLFVPKLNQQAIDRAHRIGQDESQSVQVFEYIARDTIESRIEQILKSKTALFDTVVEDSDWKRSLIAAVMEDAKR